MDNSDVVLVTGASGLVGNGIQSAVAHAIKDGNTFGSKSDWSKVKFVYLSSKDGDVRDYDQMKSLFEMHKPTAVIHLAARVGGLFANMNDNIGFFNDNMRMSMVMTDLCHEYKVQKAIFCLSTCIFPADSELPLKESYIHLGPPHFSNEGYALSKRMLEALVRFYRTKHNYDWTCVIPTNLYGPHDNYNLSDAHVLPALIHKMYNAKKNNTKLTVMGSGKPLRQFLYSEDAGKLILRVLEADSENKNFATVILAPKESEEVSIRELVMKLAKSMDFPNGIIFDASQADGIYRKGACPDLLLSFVGETLTLKSIDEGVQESADWFVNNYINARK